MSDLDDEFFAIASGAAPGGGGGGGASSSKSSKRKSTSKSKSSKSSSNSNKKQKKSSSKVITPVYVEEGDSASDMDMSAGSDEDDEAQATTSANTNANARRGRPSNSNNKAKYQEDSDADAYGEEEEEEEEEDVRAEFPLEGKYRNSKDKAEINDMSEFDRERILGERADKISQDQSRKDLRKMVKAKEKEGGREATRATDRNRKTTGATDIKASQLAKLKKARETKGKKKDQNSSSSPQKRRDSSEEYEDRGHQRPDSDSEEGEVSDSYENDLGTPTTRSKGGNKKESGKSSKKDKSSQALTLEDLKGCIVTRERMVPFLNAPWFADWIKNSFVRYLVGKNDAGELAYRLGTIAGVREGVIRPYVLEGINTTIEFKLQIGEKPAWMSLEGSSNSPPTDRELNRTVIEAAIHKVKLPDSKTLAEIRKNLASRKEYVMSEADLSAHLAKKGLDRVNPFQSKAKLLIQRDFARSTGNEQLLSETETALQRLVPVATANSKAREAESERMSKVNERNRKKDREEIKKYEAKSMEERRKLAESLRKGEAVKIDASARVKTLTRLTYDRASDSRPSTPGPDTPTSLISSPAALPLPTTPFTALDSDRRKSAFEKMVTDQVEIDVDLDF